MRTNVWIYQTLVCVVLTAIDSGKRRDAWFDLLLVSSVHNYLN